MGDVDVGLINQYLTRVNQLACKAESGAEITADLGRVVGEAIDHFAIVHNPAAQLEGFIGQLKISAEVLREKSPVHAEVLSRAVTIAARASVEPQA